MPACFIFSTAFITSSFLTSYFLTLSSKFTLFIMTSTTLILFTSNHFFFTSVCSLLSFFTPTSQSGLLLNPFALPILLPEICFNTKSNLDRYRAHRICLWFNFWLLMKYSRFLWSVHTSNLLLAPSRKCLHASRHCITASISLSYIS